jgi:hypothetical protein
VFPNRLDSIRKFVNKLGPVNQLRACYEAGPAALAFSVVVLRKPAMRI